MITTIGISLLSFAVLLWLTGDTSDYLTRMAIVTIGGAGVILLIAVIIILSLRYLP